MTIDRILLGQAIKRVREYRGIKQKDLASSLDITQNYLSLVENGHRGISFPLMEELAKKLDFPYSFLYTLGTDKKKINEPEYRGIIEYSQARIEKILLQ